MPPRRIAFLKLSRLHARPNASAQVAKMLETFLASLEGTVPGLVGRALLAQRTDSLQFVVLTLWGSVEEMDAFFGPGNRRLQGFLAGLGPLLEQLPERTDYQVLEFVD